MFSYLRHVKRLGICLHRGRSRSIINIHEIVTSRWWIERCHRRRASGIRVERDAGHTSLSKALVFIIDINLCGCDVLTTNGDTHFTRHLLKPSASNTATWTREPDAVWHLITCILKQGIIHTTRSTSNYTELVDDSIPTNNNLPKSIISKAMQ